MIDLATLIVSERGYRYQDESDDSSSEVGSDIEQAFEEVSFEVCSKNKLARISLVKLFFFFFFFSLRKKKIVTAARRSRTH